MPREVEWQFEAQDSRTIVDWLRDRGMSFGQPALQTDIYLDTPCQRFLRAGRSLRIRKKGRLFEATLKSLDLLSDGLADRLELSIPLDSDLAEDLTSLPGSFGDTIRALAGRKPIRSFVVIHNERRTSVAHLDSTILEIALDDCFAFNSEGVGWDLGQRLEIEAKAGAESAASFVQAMQAELSLDPVTKSKLPSALDWFGLALPYRTDLAPLHIHDAIDSLAERIVAEQMARMTENEPKARLGEDTEAVHDMRVAIRRLRVAFGLFDAIILDAGELRITSKRLFDSLSAVRDLDVQIETLTRWGIPTEVIDDLKSQLVEARQRMLAELDTTDFFERCCEVPSFPASIGSAAADLVGGRAKKARKAGDDLVPNSPVISFHELRKELKKLRYTAEFFNCVAEGEVKSFTKKLTALQDLLGELQDLQVTVEKLEAHRVAFDLFGWESLVQQREAREKVLRKEIPKAYKAAFGKPWRSLRQALIDASVRAWRTPLPTAQENE